MTPLLREIRHNPLLWPLALVPVVLAAQVLRPEAHTLLFVLSVMAIVPLAALLSRATESVATRTGDMIGGLLNATLGNLTELLIALAALRAGQYVLVKASIAGAIVTNALFMLGASFLLGGLKHHVQEYNRNNARLQAGLLFLATIAMLVPSVVINSDATATTAKFTQTLSTGLSVLLIVTYGLGLVFSLKTHSELFAGADHASPAKSNGQWAFHWRRWQVLRCWWLLSVRSSSSRFNRPQQRLGYLPHLSALSSWRWWGLPQRWCRRYPPPAKTG